MCQHIVSKAVGQSSQGLACCREYKNRTNSTQGKLTIALKVTLAFTLWLAIELLEIYPTDMAAHKQNVHMRLYIAALFIIARD